MGLLDQLGSALGGMGGQGGQDQLVQVIMGLLQNHEGGLSGLVSKFSQAGLGEQVASWIGTGSNLPVAPDQLRAALGDGTVGNIASQLGLSDSAAADSLAGMLPQVIDKLTPHGDVSEAGGMMQQGLSALAGMLGGKL